MKTATKENKKKMTPTTQILVDRVKWAMGHLQECAKKKADCVKKTTELDAECQMMEEAKDKLIQALKASQDAGVHGNVANDHSDLVKFHVNLAKQHQYIVSQQIKELQAWNKVAVACNDRSDFMINDLCKAECDYMKAKLLLQFAEEDLEENRQYVL